LALIIDSLVPEKGLLSATPQNVVGHLAGSFDHAIVLGTVTENLPLNLLPTVSSTPCSGIIL